MHELWVLPLKKPTGHGEQVEVFPALWDPASHELHCSAPRSFSVAKPGPQEKHSSFCAEGA